MNYNSWTVHLVPLPAGWLAGVVVCAADCLLVAADSLAGFLPATGVDDGTNNSVSVRLPVSSSWQPLFGIGVDGVARPLPVDGVCPAGFDGLAYAGRPAPAYTPIPCGIRQPASVLYVATLSLSPPALKFA